MKRLDPESRDLIAGEYVLGTLPGPARRRFARLMRTDRAAAAAAARWEIRLGALAAGVEPVVPGPWIWRGIERRLGFDEPAPKSPRVPPWKLNLWRGAAALGAAAALVLGAALFTMEPVTREVPVKVEVPVPQPVPVETMAAVLTGEQARSAWMVSGRADGERLTVRALNPESLPADRAYELWLLPEGRDPVSLGLIPEAGERSIQPSPELRDLIRPGVALAVSLEPAGGSPTGLPTGPVLYQGKTSLL